MAQNDLTCKAPGAACGRLPKMRGNLRRYGPSGALHACRCGAFALKAAIRYRVISDLSGFPTSSRTRALTHLEQFLMKTVGREAMSDQVLA
jgi:hypothetical protein